jgi:S-adenosylmethionine:tRNA ribosyltransferase-isomerase
LAWRYPVKTRDFFFDLPEELIAQFPADRRENSRLLCLDRHSGAVSHRLMTELPALLPENALLVLNDSRVRKARMYAHTEGGAEREFLFLKPEDGEEEGEGEIWTTMAKRPSRLKPDSRLTFPGGTTGTVVGHSDQFVSLHFPEPLGEEFFELHGHVPLPPYIRRDDQTFDADRYQTVYASPPGSVAAPTAGLHLTNALLEDIASRGVETVRVTLHVGPGTFLPVRSVEIADHIMHSEVYDVSPEAAAQVNAALREKRPVVAIGTTSVRTLEAAFDPGAGQVVAGNGATELFITPGYRFTVVSGMLTNFHTPESTLLMLVCALAGRDQVLAAYAEAITQRYRFFSYGDGMLIQ